MTKAIMSKTQALELATQALRDSRLFYTYRMVLQDVEHHLERYERKEVDQEQTIAAITRSLNVYRYEMKGEK